MFARKEPPWTRSMLRSDSQPLRRRAEPQSLGGKLLFAIGAALHWLFYNVGWFLVELIKEGVLNTDRDKSEHEVRYKNLRTGEIMFHAPNEEYVVVEGDDY